MLSGAASGSTPKADRMPRAGGTILALGELLVEVMRTEKGVPLDTLGDLRGPFASGAPAIFATAAARLGADVRFAGVRGADAFGELCERELVRAGVSTASVRTDPDATTGIAFVSYREDGGRDFLFHLPQAAAARLAPEDVTEELVLGVEWLHVTGSSLAVSESMRQACYRAVDLAHAAGATISFDPNLRLELMEAARVRDLCAPVLARAGVVLPSGSEATLLTETEDSASACRALLDGAASVVVHKQGAQGSTVHTAEGSVHVPTMQVTEVDPTGAGDCFAAGFAVARLEGGDVQSAARFANVVGALSTTAFGPMEGAPDRTAVDRVLSA
jgi:sugar/nucleoside kinase (ribokinase family)